MSGRYALACCAAIISTGDPVTISATFAVSPGQAISSP